MSRARRLVALAVFLFSAALSHAQVERPLQWLQDLRDLQRGAGDPSTVAKIRQDVETWLQVHPESKVTLAAAPPQPWDDGQIAAQIKLLLATVGEIVKHQPAFDLGVTQVNVSDTISSLSPVADSIDAIEIQNRDAMTVNQAIDYLPGVSVDHKDPRNQTGISIRGFDTRQVPLYLDGVPIYVPFDGYPDLTRFVTTDIAEIEVAKGYSTALAGPNALGGVINLVTREPQDKLDAQALLGTGSGNILNTSLHLGSRWRHFFALGGLDWLQSDYYPLSGNFQLNKTQPTDHRVNSYQRDERFNGRIGWAPKGQDVYALSYINQKGSYGVPPYSGTDPVCPSGNTTVSYPCVTPKYWQWPYWDMFSYYFNGSKSLGEASTIQFRAFYDKFENSMAMYDDATYSTLYKNASSGISNNNDRSVGTSADFTTRLAKWNVLSASFFLKNDNHRQDSVLYTSKDVPNTSPWQTDSDLLTSLGIQDAITISSKLHATAGFSADHLDGLEAQDLNSTNTVLVPFQVKGICSALSPTTFTSCTDHVWGYNPVASLSYLVGKSGTLFVTFAGKTRFPTLKDRYSYKMGKALPDPALKPEHADNWTAGYSRALALRTVVEAEFFRSDVRDAIENIQFPSTLCPSMKGFCMQATNIDKELRQGADFSIRSTPLTRVTFDANYEYLNREFISGPPAAFPMGTPKHKTVGTATLRLRHKVLLLASARYEAGQVGTSDNNLPVPASKFAAMDIGGVFPIRTGFSIQAGIKNLFDRNYDYMEGFPEEGRNWYMNLRYKF